MTIYSASIYSDSITDIIHLTPTHGVVNVGIKTETLRMTTYWDSPCIYCICFGDKSQNIIKSSSSAENELLKHNYCDN